MSYIKQARLFSCPFVALAHSQVFVLNWHGIATEWNHFAATSHMQVVKSGLLECVASAWTLGRVSSLCTLSNAIRRYVLSSPPMSEATISLECASIGIVVRNYSAPASAHDGLRTTSSNTADRSAASAARDSFLRNCLCYRANVRYLHSDF